MFLKLIAELKKSSISISSANSESILVKPLMCHVSFGGKVISIEMLKILSVFFYQHLTVLLATIHLRGI